MPAFPRLGISTDSSTGNFPEEDGLLKSQFMSDEVISAHQRYPVVHKNIAARRGRPFMVKVPVYQDTNTSLVQKESFSNQHRQPGTKSALVQDDNETHIYGDTMAFGPTCCGLQVTFQAANMREARALHDQLVPLGPIMMALTAGTPFFRGYLTDTDLRWNQSTLAVDDRTSNEAEPQLSNDHSPKPPRWSSTPMYIADDSRLRTDYQPHLPVNQTTKHRLEEAGIDPALASYYTHILSYDPVALTQCDLSSRDDRNFFEIIHSTVWPHVDLKTPSAGSRAGWRVEFRPMEVQPTDFQNAACAVFVALLRRAITHFGLNFYVPIGRVAENMQRAHRRDAVRTQTFHWRKDVVSGLDGAESTVGGPVEEEYALMTVEEIVNGKGEDGHSGARGSTFVGLIPIVERYMDDVDVTSAVKEQIRPYLALMCDRASGKLWTPAGWMRDFVHSRQEYKNDSVVSERICYDLLERIRETATTEETSQSENAFRRTD